MDIHEDDFYLPDEKKKNDTEKNKKTAQEIMQEQVREKLNRMSNEAQLASKEKIGAADVGTRIIYQASEKTAKREFTGFKFDDETPSEKPKIEKVGHKAEYKGGYAFEEEMRKKNITPQKRPAPQKPPEKKISFEEEKKRRYIESVKAAQKEKEEMERLAQKQKLHRTETVKISPANKPKRSASDKVRLAVIVVAIIAMAISIGVLAKQYIQKKQGEAWEEEVSGLIIDVTEEEETTKKSSNKGDKKEPTTEKVLTIEEQWAQLYADYPDVKFPEGLSLKYAKLYATNQDFVGYLTIDGLDMGLPVVQSQKDTETENYYLRRNFYKQYSVYGCPFVFKHNDMENLDRNTIIFGHTNNSNIVFAPLNQYKTLDGFKKAPLIKFDTIYAEHTWKVVAAFIINTEAKDDSGYVFNYTFTKMKSDEEFIKYMSFVKQRSLYDTGVDILPSDKILTLSTCTYDFDNARFVVVARLVRPGETQEVNTSIAKTNESPRYPQAYYDKKKKKNPYKNYENWYYSGD